MDRGARFVAKVRGVVVISLFASLVLLACAGADGDSAPVPPEAGAEPPPPCTDAGSGG